MEIQLPDFLPSRYPNWLVLYLDVIRQFNEHGVPVNEGTKVKLYELGDYNEQTELRLHYGDEVVHYYQEFPLTIIKARAFDFIFPNLPTQEDVYRFNRDIMTASMYSNSSAALDRNREIFDKLMSICPRERQLSR
jgi:hypothetical protein